MTTEQLVLVLTLIVAALQAILSVLNARTNSRLDKLIKHLDL